MADFRHIPSPDEDRIQIRGRFDFQSHQDWRKVVDKLKPAARCVVDLSQTTQVDSSALGMLLMLKDRARETTLLSPNEDIRAVLAIARFEQIFRVEPTL